MGDTEQLTTADGHHLDAYVARPAGTPTGGLVLIQEIFGVNGHIRDVADGFASGGWLTVAPALFDRAERGVELDYDDDGMARGREIAWNLPREQLLVDLDAALDRAAEAGPVGVVGFCFGGMLAASLAIWRPDRIAAAVAYYPSQSAKLLKDERPAVPLLVHFGGDDGSISEDDRATLRAAWPEAEMHVHDGAGHGFNCDRRASWAPEAAGAARERTDAFLRQHAALAG